MVAPEAMPLSRIRELWKMAFCDRKALASVWNCGRMSSTLAMNWPFLLLTRPSRAWRSKFPQMRAAQISEPETNSREVLARRSFPLDS